MKKHYAGIIGPPNFACIAHSFMHACGQIDVDLHTNSEEAVDVCDIDMAEHTTFFSLFCDVSLMSRKTVFHHGKCTSEHFTAVTPTITEAPS